MENRQVISKMTAQFLRSRGFTAGGNPKSVELSNQRAFESGFISGGKSSINKGGIIHRVRMK